MPHHLDAARGDTSSTWREEISWVTTPIEVGGLADSFFRVSMGNPQRGALESPVPNTDHEVSELDMGLWWCLYCLQLDVMMVQDLSRPPPLQHLWTVAIIKDMVVTDAPNVRDCVILSPGSALLFFSHHQEPQEGLYLIEAQELAEEMTKTTTWMGQPVHQQFFPITIVEGRWAIFMSCTVSDCWDHQFPTETIQRTTGEAQVMSIWTDEDKDGGTHPSSPSVMFIGRRRHPWGWHRMWTPLPHFPGLGHSMNPIQYPPQLNFPPPPLMTPILLGVPPPPYSLPPPPITALLAPALLAMQAVAPLVQANITNAPIPTTQPAANPVAPVTALVLVTGGTPDPLPPPPPGSEPGSMVDFDNMSVSRSSTTSASSVQGCAPHPQVPTGGFHLPDLTSLTDTMAYEMWPLASCTWVAALMSWSCQLHISPLKGMWHWTLWPMDPTWTCTSWLLNLTITLGSCLMKTLWWKNCTPSNKAPRNLWSTSIPRSVMQWQGWLQHSHMPCPPNEQKKLGRPASLVGYVLTLSPLWPGKCA